MQTEQTEENGTIALLALAADGDVASWGQLLTQSVERLARFIALRLDRRLQGRIDAEDVIQEIYVEAWRHLPEYRRNPSLPFYLWLRGLARNKLFELHRQHLGAKMRDARREAHAFRPAAPEATSAVLVAILLDSNTSPSEAAVREEVRTQLQDALEKMDALDREVLALRHFEQLAPAETAQVLGIQEKAAGMRYLRALKRLRKVLAELPGGPFGTASMNKPTDDECLLSDLAHEFTQRLRLGERPSIEEYAQRYPDLAADINELFSTLLLIEPPLSMTASETPAGPSDPPWKLDFKTFGEYRILREVARGGMGIVYEAIHETLGRRVALKVLPSRSVADSQRLARFRREAQASARLHHSNIVPIYDVGEVDGVHFYTMQFIDGQPLNVRVDQPLPASSLFHQGVGRWQAAQLAKIAALGNLPDPIAERSDPPEGNRASTSVLPYDDATEGGPAATISKVLSGSGGVYYRHVARLGKQVAAALAYAHREGVLHRDIKPGNLLLDVHGTVWITDFGLALVAGQDELTSPGDVVGTLRYLPPERFDGHVDERGDIYSLGVTLYEMLAGRPAFAASTRARLIDQILNTGPTAPRRIDPLIPRDLETIVLKAMSREPSQRYPRAESMAEDLDRIVTGRPISARRLSAWGHVWRWCRRNKALAAMTTIAITLLVGISVVSTVASIQLKRQLDATRIAQRESRERRVGTLIAQGAATRLTGRVGQRFEAVRALREATQIARELSLPEETFDRLRNELIAASCLTDVENVGDPIDLPPGTTFDVDPQFERYAIGDDSGNVSVYRLEDKELLVSLPGVGIPVADYGGVVFSPDGQFLQHLSRDGQRKQLRLWQLAPKPRLVLDLPDALWAAFRPNGEQIAIKLPDIAEETALYQFPRSASIHLYETATGREVSVPFRSKDTASFTFHPLLPRLAVTDSRSIHVIDLETLEELERWESPGNLFPLWDAEGRILVSTNDDDLLIYRRDTFRHEDLTPLAGHKTKGVVYTLNHAGDMMVSNDWSGTLRLWDVRGGRLLLAAPAGGFSTSMRFGPDDRLLSGAAGKGVMQLLRIWPGQELRQFDLEADSGIGNFPRAVVSPDGRILAATSKSATVLLDSHTGTKMAEFPGVRLPLIFDSDRSLITHAELPEGLTRWTLVANETHSQILNVAAKQPLKAAIDEREEPVALGGLDEWAASADAHLIAMPNYARGANLLVANGTESPHDRFRLLQLGPQHDVRFCAISPDGKWVATGSHWTPGSVTVWDAATGKRVRDVVSDRGIPKFSPDGQWLAVFSNSSVGGGRLFRVGSWEPGPVITLGYFTFDPSSQMMAVEFELSVIRLLVPHSGKEIARLTVPNMTRLKPVYFSPDGSHLAAFGLNDGQLYVWDLRAIRRRLAEFGLDWDDSPGVLD